MDKDTETMIARIANDAAVATEIVRQIVEDISDRRGLKSEWAAIAPDIQQDIIRVWVQIIMAVMAVRER